MNIISIITLGLIVATSLLVKRARETKLLSNYVAVMIGALATFIFDVVASISLGINADESGSIVTGILLTARIFGIWFFIWSILGLVRHRNNKK